MRAGAGDLGVRVYGQKRRGRAACADRWGAGVGGFGGWAGGKYGQAGAPVLCFRLCLGEVRRPGQVVPAELQVRQSASASGNVLRRHACCRWCLPSCAPSARPEPPARAAGPSLCGLRCCGGVGDGGGGWGWGCRLCAGRLERSECEG